MEVTEKIIAKAGLTNEEAKIIRSIHDLPTAGIKTENWINNLSADKYDSLRASAEEKLRDAL